MEQFLADLQTPAAYELVDRAARKAKVVDLHLNAREEALRILIETAQSLVRLSITYTEHGRRKTLTVTDLKCGIRFLWSSHHSINNDIVFTVYSEDDDDAEEDYVPPDESDDEDDENIDDEEGSYTDNSDYDSSSSEEWDSDAEAPHSDDERLAHGYCRGDEYDEYNHPIYRIKPYNPLTSDPPYLGNEVLILDLGTFFRMLAMDYKTDLHLHYTGICMLFKSFIIEQLALSFASLPCLWSHNGCADLGTVNKLCLAQDVVTQLERALVQERQKVEALVLKQRRSTLMSDDALERLRRNGIQPRAVAASASSDEEMEDEEGYLGQSWEELRDEEARRTNGEEQQEGRRTSMFATDDETSKPPQIPPPPLPLAAPSFSADSGSRRPIRGTASKLDEAIKDLLSSSTVGKPNAADEVVDDGIDTDDGGGSDDDWTPRRSTGIRVREQASPGEDNGSRRMRRRLW